MKSTKGKDMYFSQFLAKARFASDTQSGLTYFHGECHAEMRKHQTYFVDVALRSACGEVVAAHCDCSVGSGETAHCKHTFVLMHAVEHLCREKQLILRTVCTQQLQTFHQPTQQYFGTPIKAENLKCGRVKRKIGHKVAHDSISVQRYRDRVSNLIVNYAASHTNAKKIPISTLIMPANPFAVVWDHAYACESQLQQLLKKLKLLSISKEEIQAIEMETRGQAANKKWFIIRCSHLTSSKFFEICHAVSVGAKKNLAKRLVSISSTTSAAMEHGRAHEDDAIKAFEKLYGVKVLRPGVLICILYPYLAASLDALIGTFANFTIVEVKCPATAKNMPINEITVPFLERDTNGNLTLASECEYNYQIQGQMLVTGASSALLVVYTLKDLKVIPVAKDDFMIHEIMCHLEDFYEHYFKPALFDKYIYKNYDSCIKCNHH